MWINLKNNWVLFILKMSVFRGSLCIYNVTLRRVLLTVLAVEKQTVLADILWVCVCVCVSNLVFPARKAHAPCYISICALSDSTTFFHIIS